MYIGSSYDGMNMLGGQTLTTADDEKIISLERYAEFCEAASDVFLKMALKSTKIRGKAYQDMVEDLTTQMIYELSNDDRGFLQQSDDMRASAGAVWLSAGISHMEVATGMEAHETFMNKNICEDGMICRDIINNKDIKNINDERNLMIKNNNFKNNEDGKNDGKTIAEYQEIIFQRYAAAVKCFQMAMKYGIFATNTLNDDDLVNLLFHKKRKSDSLITQTKIQIQVNNAAKTELGKEEEEEEIRLLKETQDLFADFIRSPSTPPDTTSFTTVPSTNVLLSPAKGVSNPFSAPLGAPCRVLLW